MKLHLVAVGTKMPDWVQTGFSEYLRRFPKDMPFELVEIPAGKRGKNDAGGCRQKPHRHPGYSGETLGYAAAGARTGTLETGWPRR